MSHGLKTRIIVGGNDLSGLGHTAKMTLGKALAPSETFLDSDAMAECGLKNATFMVEARYKSNSAAMQARLDDIIGTADLRPVIAYAPEGFAIGSAVYGGETYENDSSFTADTGSVVGVSLGFVGNGGLFVGTVLESPYV